MACLERRNALARRNIPDLGRLVPQHQRKLCHIVQPGLRCDSIAIPLEYLEIYILIIFYN